jgi:hypothetical protein
MVTAIISVLLLLVLPMLLAGRLAESRGRSVRGGVAGLRNWAILRRWLFGCFPTNIPVPARRSRERIKPRHLVPWPRSSPSRLVPCRRRRQAHITAVRQSFHLIEQPIDGICSTGPRPFSATCFIASKRSRRTFGMGVVREASSLPRYCNSSRALKPKKSGVH